MPLQRAVAGDSVVDILDHILDKGIVIDAWLSVSLAGIDLLTSHMRIVVSSIETYLKHAGTIAQLATIARNP